MWGKLLQMGDCEVGLIEGVCFKDGDIWINVEYLWDDTRNEDKFIKRFAKAYQHELMHRIFLDMPKKYTLGEEMVIRKYVDKEKWRKSLTEFYKHDFTKSIPKRQQRPKSRLK
jgi:hypothetical protein